MRYWTGALWDCELSLLLHAHKIRVAANHPLPCFNGRLAKNKHMGYKYTCAVFNYQLRYGSQLHNNRLTEINQWLLIKGNDRSQMTEVTHLFAPIWTTLPRPPCGTPLTKRSHTIIYGTQKLPMCLKWPCVWVHGCVCAYVCTTLRYYLLNFNGWTVEVWEWISNFTPHFIMDVIGYPCWDQS